MFIPLRDEAPRSRLPAVTLTLIIANLLIHLVQRLIPATANTTVLYGAGAIPFEIAKGIDLVDGVVHHRAFLPVPFTLISSMFLHGGIEHLIGNLWFLWIFGDNIEGAMGPWRFLAFYLVVGCLAAAAQVLMTPGSRIPIVGASGAIAGLLGAFLVLYPRARVHVLLFLVVVIQVVVVPAFVVLGAWLLWQLIANVHDGSIAIWAHVWGFLAGLVTVKLFVRRPAPAPARAPAAVPTWRLETAPASSSSLPSS